MNHKSETYSFKFSVITAVYNVASYLSEAIESILCQDIGFKDSVELILVDDGSTDSSGKICDHYQTLYPDNIKVLHKPNGGAASARNAGIALASGRYLNFLDGDDKLSPCTLSAVYHFFSTVDDQISLVSVPIQFFEKKETAHRLNYKYKDGKNQIINLNTQYSYVQMSIASSFIKREVLNEHSFDTSLRYAEDAKVIMQLLLEHPYYGIVPSGCYYYRFRNTQNSALNGTKLHKEWYLDCLKDYLLWALQTARQKYGSIPLFVQYNVMYDLQSRFGVPEIPASILSPDEHEEFRTLLREILRSIDDKIILQQRNLSREQKDYIISLKHGKGSLKHCSNDIFFQYDCLKLYPASSYLLKLFHAEISDNNLKLTGAVKFNRRFPNPSALYVRLHGLLKTHTFPCDWSADTSSDFIFDGTLLSQFLNFEVRIPLRLLRRQTRLQFCMTCDEHSVIFKNLRDEPGFPDILSSSKNSYQFCVDSDSLFLKRQQI
ncbi:MULTISPECIES: glycosyltransferase family 2 protein [Blautia]|jgi:glycosyltransferase involved in cell wall biosynthesis|uniref:glycosyltransferase family 2 protein n=1 Tax=Blautia TaxID=572511 RepID=UPI00137049B8|nr:glycosyltransferase [Blautia sp. BIOML-A1]MZT65141.1 glycosyltransferase [Blautia sp. BIOML-A1]